MIFLNDERPIIACSTPMSSNSAIGKIRISGFKDLLDLKSFFPQDITKLTPKKASVLSVGTEKKILDEAVCIFFKAPHSYNGENILELDVHGNQLNIRRILEFFTEKDLIRMAYPGEFTYRALLNKKMMLSQVEGLDLLINAQSSLAFDEGMATLRGELSEKYRELFDLFLQLKSSLELSMDFLEDMGEENAKREFDNSLKNFSQLVSHLFERTRSDINSLITPTVVLLGQTNAGKSSLFNHLLLNNRSIVSSMAGTTRDYVSEPLFIENTNFKLVDTAGIRQTVDQIEKFGIEKTFDQIKNAFFKILVINPFETNMTELNLLKDVLVDLVVFTHADQQGFSTEGIKISGNPKILFANLGPIGPVELGGPIGPGIESGPIGPKIKEEIIKKFKSLSKDNPILIERHRHVIGEIYDKTLKFQELTAQEGDIGILSSELNLLGLKVSDLIGIVSPEDVLTRIFSNFCIGK
jgi:tRNA modification GTPase